MENNHNRSKSLNHVIDRRESNKLLSPYSPSMIDVKFKVYTNDNRNLPKFIEINSPEIIANIGINSHAHIYVIFHGFLESGNRPWISTLTQYLLDYEKDATVLVVDWSKGSSIPYYQAAANIRVVG